MVAAGDSSDVFISYARSDEAAALELNGWLNDHGISTFFDRNKLRRKAPWTSVEWYVSNSKVFSA